MSGNRLAPNSKTTTTSRITRCHALKPAIAAVLFTSAHYQGDLQTTYPTRRRQVSRDNSGEAVVGGTHRNAM
jgi:hypothetical protein